MKRDDVERTLRGLNPQSNAMIGTAVGTIEVCILQPMLYCKTATQQGLPLTLNPKILYRGLTMSVCNMAVLTGLQFPLASVSGKLLSGGENRPLTSAETIGAGFIGGALSGLVCSPMELTIINQQRAGTSLFATPAALAAEHGMFSLTRGLVASCAREGIYTAGYLGMAPVFGKYLRDNYGLGTVSSGIAGAISAGVIVGTASHPADTIKTCMQGDVGCTKFGTATETARTLYAEGGLSRFFSGWTWRTGRMCLGVFIMNEVKVIIAPRMFPAQFEEA